MDISVRVLDRIPENFHEFVEEDALGIFELYGPAAESQYRDSALENLEISIDHPSVCLFAVQIGDETAGYITCINRSSQALIAHIHVLKKHLEKGVEEALVRHCVDHARRSGKSNIVSESVLFAPLRLDETYADMGFQRIERLIMGKALGRSNKAVTEVSREAEAGEDGTIARILVEAYNNHSSRRLHLEVADETHAAEFLASVRRDGYGKTRPEFIRAIDRAGVPAGVVIGCLVAPDVGFVLQVAVVPEYQGEGLGSALIAELEREFHDAGLQKVALGVTCDNPARHLYERLGFESWRRVTAYVWHDE